MHVTALHHIGLLLLLNLYAYITDKRAFRQTKHGDTCTGTGTIRYRYVFTRTQSGSFCRAHHCDRPIDHATPSVNNKPHLGNYTVVRPSNIGCSSAQRIIQNEPRAAHFRPAF